MFALRFYTFAIYLLTSLDLVLRSDSCGAAAGAGNLANSQKYSDLVSQVVGYVPKAPGSVGLVKDGVIIDYLNENLVKVFGGNMKVSQYQTGSDGGKPITCASDLDCTFDKPCRWRNGVDPQADIKFYKTEGQPNVQNLDTLTGSNEKPNPPFILCGGNTDSQRAWFISDPVPKQIGTAFIEFKYWMTPLVELKICTRKPGADKLGLCSEIVTSAVGGAKATKVVKIMQPIEQPFEIVFEFSHFIVKPGGILMLDDLKYYGQDDCKGPKALPPPTKLKKK